MVENNLNKCIGNQYSCHLRIRHLYLSSIIKLENLILLLKFIGKNFGSEKYNAGISFYIINLTWQRSLHSWLAAAGRCDLTKSATTNISCGETVCTNPGYVLKSTFLVTPLIANALSWPNVYGTTLSALP